MTPTPGSVSVAPSVLVRLVDLAVREVPGVVRLGALPPSAMLGAAVGTGIALRQSESGALIDCYVIAAPETNLLELGMAVQATVAAVAHDLAGVTAREVNVYIQDVEVARG